MSDSPRYLSVAMFQWIMGAFIAAVVALTAWAADDRKDLRSKADNVAVIQRDVERNAEDVRDIKSDLKEMREEQREQTQIILDAIRRSGP